MANDKDRGRRPADDEEIDDVPHPEGSDLHADGDPLHPNPPFTSTKRMTSPKFGSAGGGGAENEPGPERD